MKKILLISFFTILLKIGFSQIAPDTYVIRFKDKIGTKYSIDKPEEFLSQRALNFKKKYKIPITEQDLPVSETYVNKLKDMGFEVLTTSKWFNLAVVKTEKKKLLNKAKNLDFVLDGEPEKIKKNPNNSVQTYKAPEFEIIPAHKTDVYAYGKANVQNEMIRINYLHNEGFSGEGIQIAVLDAGFKHADKLPVFEELFKNKKILGVRDFVDRDGEVYLNDSHGMQVLSTMGANLPGIMVGTAPKANFWLIRTEQAATEYLVEEYYWIAGAELADSLGCDIIHSSLGYNDFDDKTTNHTYEDMDGNSTPISIAADIASAKGILVVTSAGNDGYSEWKYITAPADADSILTVGAATGEKGYAYFSSKGPTYDKRIKPDAMAMGMWTAIQDNNGTISEANGTSFSGPIIAGAAACLWQANPEATNMEIIEAIRKSGDRYEKPDGDFGFGIANFAKADQYLKKLKK